MSAVASSVHGALPEKPRAAQQLMAAAAAVMIVHGADLPVMAQQAEEAEELGEEEEGDEGEPVQFESLLQRSNRKNNRKLARLLHRRSPGFVRNMRAAAAHWQGVVVMLGVGDLCSLQDPETLALLAENVCHLILVDIDQQSLETGRARFQQWPEFQARMRLVQGDLALGQELERRVEDFLAELAENYSELLVPLGGSHHAHGSPPEERPPPELYAEAQGVIAEQLVELVQWLRHARVQALADGVLDDDNPFFHEAVRDMREQTLDACQRCPRRARTEPCDHSLTLVDFMLISQISSFAISIVASQLDDELFLETQLAEMVYAVFGQAPYLENFDAGLWDSHADLLAEFLEHLEPHLRSGEFLDPATDPDLQSAEPRLRLSLIDTVLTGDGVPASLLDEHGDLGSESPAADPGPIRPATAGAGCHVSSMASLFDELEWNSFARTETRQWPWPMSQTLFHIRSVSCLEPLPLTEALRGIARARKTLAEEWEAEYLTADQLLRNLAFEPSQLGDHCCHHDHHEHGHGHHEHGHHEHGHSHAQQKHLRLGRGPGWTTEDDMELMMIMSGAADSSEQEADDMEMTPTPEHQPQQRNQERLQAADPERSPPPAVEVWQRLESKRPTKRRRLSISGNSESIQVNGQVSTESGGLGLNQAMPAQVLQFGAQQSQPPPMRMFMPAPTSPSQPIMYAPGAPLVGSTVCWDQVLNRVLVPAVQGCVPPAQLLPDRAQSPHTSGGGQPIFFGSPCQEQIIVQQMRQQSSQEHQPLMPQGPQLFPDVFAPELMAPPTPAAFPMHLMHPLSYEHMMYQLPAMAEQLEQHRQIQELAQRKLQEQWRAYAAAACAQGGVHAGVPSQRLQPIAHSGLQTYSLSQFQQQDEQ